MELDAPTKKAILEQLISQLEASKYSNEVMGQTWQTIGNAEGAKQCAEKLSENIKMIAELQKKLDALSDEESKPVPTHPSDGGVTLLGNM